MYEKLKSGGRYISKTLEVGEEARVNLRMHWKINELVDLIQNHPSRVFCMKEASDQAQFT